MPRRSKIRRGKKGRRRILFLVALLALALSLAWIWKANRVKELYSQMKKMDETKKILAADNTQLQMELTELKSLIAVDKVATRKLCLTQNVHGRIYLQDPVKRTTPGKAFDYVNIDKVTDWLEDAVVRSGKVTAKESPSETK